MECPIHSRIRATRGRPAVLILRGGWWWRSREGTFYGGGRNEYVYVQSIPQEKHLEANTSALLRAMLWLRSFSENC